MMNQLGPPCIFEFASESDKIIGSPYEASLVENASGVVLAYVLPIPSKVGNRRLNILGLRIGLSYADGSNKVIRQQIRGIKDRGAKAVWEHEADITEHKRLEHSFNPIDMSGFHAVKALVYLEGVKKHAVRIGYVSILTDYR
ncbi:MAG: hypothetical protein GF411_10325 [Candidatus Lokiarchaeota archaeon]|nr:hypothetical protein [Candidatus Lokiarchaeota archaeon]